MMPASKGGLFMVKTFSRLGLGASAVILAQGLTAGTVHASPNDQLAWSSTDQKIKVFHDAVDPNLYWFIPKISFEQSGGKTLLIPSTTADGKTQYITRIIPYFSKQLRQLVAQNISNIRQDSQLQPVVATNFTIALPDFNYKFATPTVTDYEYLDIPRLVRFTLSAEDAATFDTLYNQTLGVAVEFTVAYTGMTTDKLYNIDINCQTMDRELSTNFKPSIGVAGNVKGLPVYAGADLEFAFLNSVQNSTNGINVLSIGDTPGMQEMLTRVMNLCFTPVDSYGNSVYNDGTGGFGGDSYPTRRDPTTDGTTGTTTDGTLPTRTGGRGDVIDDGFTPRGQFASFAMANRSSAEIEAATAEAKMLQRMTNQLDLSRKLLSDPTLTPDPAVSPDPTPFPTDPANPTGGGTDPGLLPQTQLRMKYVFKKTALDKNSQAIVKSLTLKSSLSTVTVVDLLTAAAKPIAKVQMQALANKSFTVASTNAATTPLRTGIKVNDGEQYTVNAEFIFNATSGFAMKPKQYAWDASWPNVDGELFYRIGGSAWAPVNRHTIIMSDTINGGGELQFYLDRSAIFNRIPEKLRKGNIFVGPAFTLGGIAPAYSVQVSGRRISVQ
jgi:hypothetical protein